MYCLCIRLSEFTFIRYAQSLIFETQVFVRTEHLDELYTKKYHRLYPIDLRPTLPEGVETLVSVFYQIYKMSILNSLS